MSETREASHEASQRKLRSWKLPRATQARIMAILTLGLLAGVLVLGLFLDKPEPFGRLVDLLAVIVGYYFGTRQRT